MAKKAGSPKISKSGKVACLMEYIEKIKSVISIFTSIA